MQRTRISKTIQEIYNKIDELLPKPHRSLYDFLYFTIINNYLVYGKISYSEKEVEELGNKYLETLKNSNEEKNNG